MRPRSVRDARSPEFRRALGRLEGLPIRSVSARAVIDSSIAAEPDADDPARPRFLDSDPGWQLLRSDRRERSSPLSIVADRPWWTAGGSESVEALERLWKHAVATSSTARRLAAQAGREDAEEIARAGLLQQLGLWAIAAVDSSRLAALFAIPDRAGRDELAREWTGRDPASLGRDLAERWGCGPIVEASAWLHADGSADLGGLASDPEALSILQSAYEWAERTPWALFPTTLPEPGPTDARLRILIAEVQVRCGAGLLDPTATLREEAMTRANARLRLDRDALRLDRASRDRFLATFSAGDPGEDAIAWAERASLAMCQEPGVASARVTWETTDQSASRVVPLGRSSAEVHLALDPEDPDVEARLAAILPAWSSWAEWIASRDRAAVRLDDAISSHRLRVVRDEAAEGTSRLDALAEFAGGAGHELNNPLAVILGRAQLLLPRVTEADVVKSLRIIIGQAQRAHRILRDMMYVARPPSARPRTCRPDDILRASLRDLKPEADARGIRLLSEIREPIPVAWADPEPMRHLLDVLVRNALEATPSGGSVRVSSGRTGETLSWVVKDSGRGVGLDEGKHLFEPFFCGRQAGRGLGLGLPRAMRFVRGAGGDLTWKSSPGHGSVFAVRLPITSPPVVSA